MKHEKDISTHSALVVHSGGLDSTVALAWALESFGRVEAICFRYDSKHNDREIAAAEAICRKLGVPRSLIDLSWIGAQFHSSLLRTGDAVPEGRYDAESMKSTVVPFRNGIMLAAAAGFAEDRGLEAVVIGNHSGDHAIYPDCRRAFIDAMDRAIQAGTDGRTRVLSPFCDWDKARIVREGVRLGVDFSMTYSCYNGRERHCGRCGTCTERREAFELAGVPDPTLYE